MQKRQFPKWLLWLDVIYVGLLILFKFGLSNLMSFIGKHTSISLFTQLYAGILKVSAFLSKMPVIIAIFAINVLVLLFSMMRKRGANLQNGAAQPIVINNQGSTTNVPANTVTPPQNNDGNMNFF